jgi:pimeloyl-ACP methyl ester carboxylesterase
MSGVTGFLVTVIAGYALLTAFMYLMQDRMLFLPSPSSPEIESRYQKYAVTFNTGQVDLHGWHIPAEDLSQPTIVFYGGNGQELSTSIESITALGDYHYVIVNYRGYGRSLGQPSEKDLKSDALLILHRLKAQGKISLSNTIIMGRSIGTAIAVHVAANVRSKGLILISPFNSIEAIASDLYFYLPVKWLIKHPFRSVDYVAEISVPTLIIKAENDQVVPRKYTDELIRAWQGPLEVIELEGTHHNYIETVQYFDVTNRFIESLR